MCKNYELKNFNKHCLEIMKEAIVQYAQSDDFDPKVFAQMNTEYFNARAIYEDMSKK